MAITSTTISSSIYNQLVIIGFKGPDSYKLSEVIGNALFVYLKTPNLVSCFLSGSSGVSGTIFSTGIVGLSFFDMSAFMYSRALLYNFKGIDIKKFFDAISKGICISLMGMTVTGSVVGIGTGGGIGSFTFVKEEVLSNLLLTNMIQKNFLGRDNKNICDCISGGVINHLRTVVKIPVVVTGVVSPIPPVPVVGIPSLFTQLS